MDTTAPQVAPTAVVRPPPTRLTPYHRQGSRLRRFVFTLPNWTPAEYDIIKEIDCQWMVVGKEVCPDTGTPHLQGACVLLRQMAFSTVKLMIGNRCHIESMRGTPQQSLTYCSKEDLLPFVKGVMPSPGKRNDIHDVCERVLQGETLRQLAQDPDVGAVAIVKYHKGLTILRSLSRPPRLAPPVVLWLHGETGTGKTRSCYELGRALVSGEEPLDDIWISSGSLRWFDGYDGQSVAIIDDFRSKDVANFAFLLRLLDRYPFKVEFKGGFIEWTPAYIFITSPYSPLRTFAKRNEHLPEDLNQLNRRLTDIFDMEHYPGEDGRVRLVASMLSCCSPPGIPDVIEILD